MYFYIHKIYTNEDEQTQLLEVCCNAGFRSGNGKCFQGLTTITLF
ncbi:MAG: hypothetical protein RL555_743 [Bacteroidota bacterium]|jgi:hypothetical protein